MVNKVLTISIAAYNSERFIENCLDSLIACKNKDKLEIFVIDDGGTDSTLEITNKYASEYRDIIYPVHKENGGWGSTVNYSIQHASGKYFRILDADDLFATEHIDEYISFLEESESELIITPYIEHSVKDSKSVLVTDKVLQMHGFTVRTDVLNRNHLTLLEKSYYADIEYVFKVLDLVKTCEYYNETIYKYNIGYDQQSVNYRQFINHVDEHEKVCKRVVEIYDGMQDKELCIEKKKVLDRLLELISKHYSILFMLKICSENLNRILRFNDYIDRYEYLKNNISLKRIKIIRMCKFLYYPVSVILHLRSSIYRTLKHEV